MRPTSMRILHRLEPEELKALEGFRRELVRSDPRYRRLQPPTLFDFTRKPLGEALPFDQHWDLAIGFTRSELTEVTDRLVRLGDRSWLPLGATGLALFHGPKPQPWTRPGAEARLVLPDLAYVPDLAQWLAAYRKAEGTPALEALRSRCLPEDLHDLASIRERLAAAPELWGLARPGRAELEALGGPLCLVESGVAVARDAAPLALVVDFVHKLADPVNRDRIFRREGFVPAEALAGLEVLPAPSVLELGEARRLWAGLDAPPPDRPAQDAVGDAPWLDTVLLGGACVLLLLLILVARRGGQ